MEIYLVQYTEVAITDLEEASAVSMPFLVLANSKNEAIGWVVSKGVVLEHQCEGKILSQKSTWIANICTKEARNLVVELDAKAQKSIES